MKIEYELSDTSRKLTLKFLSLTHNWYRAATRWKFDHRSIRDLYTYEEVTDLHSKKIAAQRLLFARIHDLESEVLRLQRLVDEK